MQKILVLLIATVAFVGCKKHIETAQEAVFAEPCTAKVKKRIVAMLGYVDTTKNHLFYVDSFFYDSSGNVVMEIGYSVEHYNKDARIIAGSTVYQYQFLSVDERIVTIIKYVGPISNNEIFYTEKWHYKNNKLVYRTRYHDNLPPNLWLISPWKELFNSLETQYNFTLEMYRKVYNDKGLLWKVYLDTTLTDEFMYDGKNRLIQHNYYYSINVPHTFPPITKYEYEGDDSKPKTAIFIDDRTGGVDNRKFYTYDNCGRVLSIYNEKAETSEKDLYYTYDADGYLIEESAYLPLWGRDSWGTVVFSYEKY